MPFKKGNPWRIKKGQHLFSKTEFQKGHSAPKTAFQKGHIPWNKRKKNPHVSGKKNWNWKGSKVGLGGLHFWVYRQKGKPKICEHCGEIGEKINGQWSLDWANKDHKYRRNADDYISLCASCHKKYDLLI